MKRLQRPTRSILWLFLLGAFAGTALDSLLVYAHVERYSMPLLSGEYPGVPIGLPLLYACASLAVGDVGRTLIFSTQRGNHETT